MITLAFDTALDKMHVVLRRDGETLASKIVETTSVAGLQRARSGDAVDSCPRPATRYHSADLLPVIKEVLKENDLTPQDIDLIATNIGPGSFTGIRACVTVARVMAQQIGCKALGVSSLEILSKLNTSDKPTLVALDARKGCVYTWKNAESPPAPPLTRGVIELVPVEHLDTDGYFVIDDEYYKSANAPLGEILAQIAEERGGGDWRELKPLYIQPPSIHGR